MARVNIDATLKPKNRIRDNMYAIGRIKAKLHQGKIERKKISTASTIFPTKVIPGLSKSTGSSVKENAKQIPRNTQNKIVRRASGQKI